VVQGGATAASSLVLGCSLHYHEVVDPAKGKDKGSRRSAPQALAAAPGPLLGVTALVLASAALGGLATGGIALLIQVLHTAPCC
jgi:hypothetical protein